MGSLVPLILLLTVLVSSVASIARTSTKPMPFSDLALSNMTTTVLVPPYMLPRDVLLQEYADDLNLESPHSMQSLVEEARSSSSNQVSILDTVRSNFVKYIDDHARSLQQSSGRTFASLEVALLSLAFLTFAVFLIDLVQDLFKQGGRRFRRDAPEPSSSLPDEETTTDLIVLVLSSIDTVANGGSSPDCGQKFLCHLNRSGWNASGMLGEGANYVTSALLSVFSGSKFEEGLEAAQIGKEEEDCKIHFPECPSVIRGFIPSNEAQSQPTDEKFDKNTE